MFLQVVRFISKVTLLASGGAGHIYPSTTNPLVTFSLDSLSYRKLCGSFILPIVSEEKMSTNTTTLCFVGLR